MATTHTVQHHPEPVLSINAFAAALPAALTTVRYWISQRRIESVKLGRRVFIPERELFRLREEGRRPALNAISNRVAS